MLSMRRLPYVQHAPHAHNTARPHLPLPCAAICCTPICCTSGFTMVLICPTPSPLSSTMPGTTTHHHNHTSSQPHIITTNTSSQPPIITLVKPLINTFVGRNVTGYRYARSRLMEIVEISMVFRPRDKAQVYPVTQTRTRSRSTTHTRPHNLHPATRQATPGHTAQPTPGHATAVSGDARSWVLHMDAL